MSIPVEKCENFAICNQNYTLELFIALKMVLSCFLIPPKKVLLHQQLVKAHSDLHNLLHTTQ